jgi:predicted TIM-barrel fold metal-dependent hydrolase
MKPASGDIALNLHRRNLLRAAAALGATAIAGCAATPRAGARRVFDSHCHIIDHRFPIVSNQGYTPPDFPLDDYLAQTRPLGVASGVIVSGSFHGFDQSYLRALLPRLGNQWVGITQAPNDVADRDIAALAAIGVRGLRFNVFRGRIDSVDDIVALAQRAHAVAGWHAEIYADAAALKPHATRLAKLPAVVIDHLGMTRAGLPVLLDLVTAGVRVKATGFGRVDLDVPAALEAIATRSPDALMFGTDLPSTRAKRPFEAGDIVLIEKVLGPALALKALWSNGRAAYRMTSDLQVVSGDSRLSAENPEQGCCGVNAIRPSAPTRHSRSG